MAADDNGAAFAALDEMIEACRSMPGTAQREAPRVAAALQSVIANSVASGTSPEGVAWKPTQKGNMPLRGAMSDVSVSVDGDGVTATLTGHHVFHQRGTKSKAANRAARKAGAARKAAKGAAKEARKLNRQASRAAEKAANAPTERRRKTWAKKAADAAAPAKAASSKAKGAGYAAAVATSAAQAQAGVGGLPARPIIPESMPMTLTEATRELFKKRWEEHMSVGGGQ
jgi:hypothetical protein